MRGQYQFWVPLVQIPASEDSIGGIIVPANTIVQVNRIELAPTPTGPSASNNVRMRIRRFTGNTPTLNNTTLANGIATKAVAQGNSLSPSVTVGCRGAAGTGTVWSATPTTPEDEVFGGGCNLFGGRILWTSSLQESREIGGASASYYDIRAVADSAAFGSLLLVLSE